MDELGAAVATADDVDDEAPGILLAAQAAAACACIAATLFNTGPPLQLLLSTTTVSSIERRALVSTLAVKFEFLFYLLLASVCAPPVTDVDEFSPKLPLFEAAAIN